MRRPVILAVAALAAATFTLVNGGSTSAESVCPGYTTGHLSPTGSYTAPAGFLISAVCVKAGSDVQGDGPEITNYDPPVTSVNISHSSGKDVSHFSVLLVRKVVPSTTTTSPTTSSTTTTTPQCPDPPCIPDTQATTSSTLPATTTTTSQPPSTGSTTTTSVDSTTSTSTSSTLPSNSSTTTTLPANLDIGSASTVCRRDAPFVTLTFGNQPELNGLTGTITFLDLNDNVIETHTVTYQANATIELVYPGAEIGPDGEALDWPGWMLNADGFWVLDPSDAIYREGITIVAEINPTATTTISYPPSTAACASPTGPFPPGPTPPVPGGPAQLPPTQ